MIPTFFKSSKISPSIVLIFVFCYTLEATGQVKQRINSFLPEDFQDSTSLTLHESVVQPQLDFQWIDPRMDVTFNSAYARGYNDGPAWRGKGANLQAQVGVAGRKGNFSYVLYPTLFLAQNQDFSLPAIRNPELSPFSYQFATGLNFDDNLDWVQRYGDDPLFLLHPGQSEIRYQTGEFVASLSTQNYVLGPAQFNPILLSQQGAGFPHLRIGSEPFDLKIKGRSIGKWEINLLMGMLSESSYFDDNRGNNNRYMNGLTLAYQPTFAPGLTLGFNKVLYKNTQFFEPVDLFSTLYIFDAGVRGDSIDTNDTFDQLASFTLEWNFPSVGFKAYAEFAKNDFTGNIRRFLLEPEHSRAYTLGFEKEYVTNKGNRLLINYEHTNLSRNQTYLYRPAPVFYAHGVNRQGYTNDGQLIGAGIGPGGNSDHLGVRILKENQTLGFLIQRIESNKDYFNINVQGRDNHDVEYSFGFSLSKELDNLILAFESIYSYNFNRFYADDQSNVYLSATSIIRLN